MTLPNAPTRTSHIDLGLDQPVILRFQGRVA
jgi:hypothetical protein